MLAHGSTAFGGILTGAAGGSTEPQTFVPSIFWAEPKDFQKAVQRIYHGPDKESFIELPLVVAD